MCMKIKIVNSDKYIDLLIKSIYINEYPTVDVNYTRL